MSHRPDGHSPEVPLLAEGAPGDTAAQVHEAVANHLKGSSAGDPRPEVAGVNLGAAVDVFGLGLSDLPPAFVAGVIEAYPRIGFKAVVSEAILRQVRLKPDSTIARQAGRYDLVSLIASTPFDS